MRPWLLIALILLCAGCSQFSAVGTPQFQRQVAELMPAEVSHSEAVTGFYGVPGNHKGLNDFIAPNIYEKMFVLGNGNLYSSAFNFRPNTNSFPLRVVVSTAMIEEGRWSGWIALTTLTSHSSAPFTSYMRITDDGVTGTSMKQKTAAFLARLQSAIQAAKAPST